MIKELKTEKFEGLAVLVADGYYCAEIESVPEEKFFQLNFLLDNTDEESGFFGDPVVWSIELPFDCKILGKATDLTEYECAGIVQPLWNGFMNYLLINEPVGNYKRLVKETTKESFDSLMQSLGCYPVNPFAGIFTPRIAKDKKDLGSVLGEVIYNDMRELWKEAEANTGTWLILQKL
ncbi:hypothetical protein SAMN03003324_00876 [Pedobacter antarcticus]|nr:hypothetical protein [Pedobacter antarcticus]SFE55466.1 hypothetical protein SAMN03003324_00876 [Pedobacter antarcticus]